MPILNIEATEAGLQVLDDWVNDRPLKVKLTQRQVTILTVASVPTRSKYGFDWTRVREWHPRAISTRQLTDAVLALESLKLVKVTRPAPELAHTSFGFDREGNHHWLS